MRLDKFLQVTGMIKRRVLANEACKRGMLKVNGQVAKATKEVLEGDVVEMAIPRREMVVKILKELAGGSMPKSRRDEFIEVQRDIAKVVPGDDWGDDD
jgi:ribosomal 50S subunit-recycling heat shock protein